MEQTLSEKMHDELEPIPMPRPMHEDYDEKTDIVQITFKPKLKI